MSVERMDQVVRQLIMARTDLVAGNEVMLFHQARQLGFSSDTFVTVATLADQDNCFAFNPAADKQQVARLQQALDKVRQGEPSSGSSPAIRMWCSHRRRITCPRSNKPKIQTGHPKVACFMMRSAHWKWWS